MFWQPFRVWDRHADYNDHPEQSFFQFSTEMRDAFIKRIYWDEYDPPDRVNVRCLLRLNEGVPWNATARNVLFVSQDGESANSGLNVQDTKRQSRENLLKFLRAFEVPDADNLINVQADKVEVRLVVIFEQNAYIWKDLSATGWKGTIKIPMFAIEYVNQNRTLRNIDSSN